MTVQARRMLDFTENATDLSEEQIRSQIRSHVRSRLENLIAALKVGEARAGAE